MLKFFSSFLFALLFTLQASAQFTLSGFITNEDEDVMQYATVVLLKNDSSTIISGTVSDENGFFSFPQLKKDDYMLSISYVGTVAMLEQVFLDSDRELHFSLRTSVELDEFVITSDRSNVTTMSSSGSTFYLSAKAKEAKDIYEALQEIPKISVDRNLRSISLADGSNPLILINGVRREGGIASIDPGDIENVEIIEAPSIRYSKEGYSGIVNLKVRKKTSSYHFLNGGASLNPKFVFGIVDATYEIGNENHSFYVTGQEFHLYRNKASVTDRIRTGKTVEEIKTSNMSSYFDNYLAIGGDKVWSRRDYTSFSVTLRQIPVSGNRTGQGTYEADGAAKIFAHQRIYDDRTLTNTNNFYHRHGFENSSEMEVLLRINASSNDNKAKRADAGDSYNYNSNVYFENRRGSGSLSLNYKFAPLQSFDVNVGNQAYYQRNRIKRHQSAIPIFHHKELNEHVYLDFEKRDMGKFTIAGSIGLDAYLVTSEKEKNSYYNLKPSLTIGYKPSSSHFLRLSYNRYMRTPEINQLNPFNTSTDSLVVSTGNPFLKPQDIHATQINYTFTFNNLYFEPYAKYMLHTDHIRYKGVVTDGIYVRKPENSGNHNVFQSGLNTRYRLKNIGYINGRLSFQRSFFDNGQVRNSLNGTFSLYAYYRKISISAYYSNSGVEYSPTSKYVSSPESQLTFTYKISKFWDMQGGMRFLFGNKLVEQWSYDDLYEQYYRNEFSNRGHIIMFGIRYNLNKKKTGREQKKLEEGDKGFKLIYE